MPEEKRTEDRILSYVNGLLFFYGAMDFEALYRVIATTLGRDLEKEAFRAILDRELSNEDSPYDFYLEDGFYHHLDVEDISMVVAEQNKRKEIDYRPVSENEAQMVVHKQYRTLWHPAVKKLDRLLQEHYGFSRDEALVLILDAQDMLKNAAPPPELAEYLLQDLEFKTKDEARSFMNAVMDMAGHTPRWELKGWTPHEIHERYEKRELKPFPGSQIAEENGTGKQLTLFKADRNDPCPCGSGKKFKKCCGFSGPEEAGPKKTLLQQEETATGTKPAPAEWRALYEAAVAFREAGCWEWMDNGDLFGVMDPETGETAYCCIMGCLGEHYALGAYLGVEGLESVLHLLAEEDENSPDLLFIQKCLMASFEDREALADEDRAVIKELGLRFRGKKQWPRFRSYEPGFFPWFINAWECRFLSHVLRQALEVSLRCRRNKAILECGGERTFLVRVPRKRKDKIIWEDRRLGAPLLVKEYPSFEISDELRLRKILASGLRGSAVWEIDTFWHPSPVRDEKNERPYFPKVFLILDQGRGLILRFELLSNMAEEGYRCIEAMLNLLQKNVFPSRILVEREETYCLLEKACRQLKIPLKKVKRLERMAEVREEMMEI